jgi:serine/threonine-protein kinase
MTPAYASPEQARGDPVTFSTDIYSLGVVLYELLSGHHLYQLKDRTPAEVERIICEQEPQKPSTVVNKVELHRSTTDTITITPERVAKTREMHPDKLCRTLRGDLDNITLKALQKEPRRRYASVEQLSDDIQRYLDRLPVKARRRTVSYQASKFVRRHRAEILSAILMLMLAVAVAYLALRGSSSKAMENDSIAVLRFTNTSADPNVDYLAEGIPASIIQGLSQLPNMRVISARNTKSGDLDAPALSRDLNVTKILTGKILQQGETLRVQVDLLDGKTGAELWGDRYDRKVSDLLPIQDEISQMVATKLRSKLGNASETGPAKRYTDNAEAYQLFLKGRHGCELRSAEGFRKGIGYLKEAINKDPSYALAYAELSVCLSSPAYYGSVPPQVSYPPARAAAQKALQLDPNLAEGHEALATIIKNYDWDWPSAEREYRRSIELNPNYAIGHFHYALGLSDQGRIQEALAEAREGQSRDPMSPIVNAGLAYVLLTARQSDECIQQSLTSIELDPSVVFSHTSIGVCYELKHMYGQAVVEYQRCLDLGGGLLFKAFMGHAYAGAGDTKRAEAILRELQASSQGTYVPAFDLAIVYEGLGQKQLAIEALQKAYDERDTLMVILKVAPFFDKLRDDSRFQDLERRVGVLH